MPQKRLNILKLDEYLRCNRIIEAQKEFEKAVFL